MTRINVVPVAELTDRHLLAEYRELPRIFGLVIRAVQRGETHNDPRIPEAYTLGHGHVRFFYPRLQYCWHRCEALYHECRRRGFQVRYQPDSVWQERIPLPWWNQYRPTPNALAINRARLAERLGLEITAYHDRYVRPSRRGARITPVLARQKDKQQ